MRPRFSPIGVGLFLLVTACGGAGDAVQTVPVAVVSIEPTMAATASVTVVAERDAVAQSVTASPDASGDASSSIPTTPDLVPLSELSLSAVGAADAAGYRVGVAVLRLDDGVAYVGGDEGRFALASVSKLALAAGALRRAELEGRELSSNERALLSRMLLESENGPAVVLWSELGAGGIDEALSSYGVSGFWMPPDEQWGDMSAAAVDVAKLMSLFVSEGSPLRMDDRLFVLSLLRSVAEDQRWGVSAGVDLSDDAETVLAIKDGWYPEHEIWRINSAGAVTVAGETDYVVVVLSDGAVEFAPGVRVVEEVAAAVNGALYPPELLVALPPFVPTASVPDVDSTATADPPESSAAETPSAVEAIPTEATPEATGFARLGVSEDLLVPTAGLLTSEVTDGVLAMWFEVPGAEIDALMADYLGSMRQLGWLTVSGPPQVVLSKTTEGRFVAVKALPGPGGGGQVVEFKIAPVPSSTVGAATVQ